MAEPMSDDWLNQHTEHLISEMRKRWIDNKDQRELTKQDAEFDLLALLSIVLSQQHHIRRMREIVQAVATENMIAHEGDSGDIVICPFCNGHEKPIDVPHPIDDWFVHEPDCAVLKARALVKGE